MSPPVGPVASSCYSAVPDSAIIKAFMLKIWADRLACSCHLLHQQSIRYPWLWALIWAHGSYKPRHLRAGRPSGLVVAARCSSLLSLRPSCLSSSAFAVLLCILDCSCFQRVFHRASCLTPLRPALDSLHSMPPICFNFTAPGCLASACMLRELGVYILGPSSITFVTPRTFM